MTSPSTALAREVVTALVRSGVTEVVIAPGSRNAPLSFAVYDAAEAGLLRLHTRVDERADPPLGPSRRHASDDLGDRRRGLEQLGRVR